MAYHLKFRIKQNKKGWFAIQLKEAGFLSFLRPWEPTSYEYQYQVDANLKEIELKGLPSLNIE